MYDYGRTTLINNYTRIYKGGSWQDDAYWLSPGTKRFLNEDLAQSSIGFRCVVDHLGYVSGGEYEEVKISGGNWFLKGSNKTNSSFEGKPVDARGELSK